jgi:hypothetical protein
MRRLNAGARAAPITNEVTATTGRDAKQILAGGGPRHPNKPNAPTTVADAIAAGAKVARREAIVRSTSPA